MEETEDFEEFFNGLQELPTLSVDDLNQELIERIFREAEIESNKSIPILEEPTIKEEVKTKEDSKKITVLNFPPVEEESFVVRLTVDELMELSKHRLMRTEPNEIGYLIYKFLVYIYGEDYVDAEYIERYGHSELTPGLIGQVGEPLYNYLIYFPKLTVLSESGKTHEITDFYVSLRYYSEGVYIARISGIRKSCTIAEYDSIYSFSHISSRPGDFGNFCVGRGNIGSLFQSAEGGLMEEMSIAELFLLLFYIKSISSYESISGTPYVRISSIMRKKGAISSDFRGINTIYSKSEFLLNFNSYYSGVIKEAITISRKGVLKANYLYVAIKLHELIKHNEDFVRRLYESTIKNSIENSIDIAGMLIKLKHYGILTKYDFSSCSVEVFSESTNYLDIEELRTNNSYSKVIFKEKEVPFRITDKVEAGEDLENEDLSLHPIIIDSLIGDYVYNLINEKTINEYEQSRSFDRKF